MQLLPRTSGDYGADVIAEKSGNRIAIQAKHYTGTVDHKSVVEVLGSLKRYRCSHGIVITNSTFRKTAIELAKDNGVELWDRNRLSREILEIAPSNQINKVE